MAVSHVFSNAILDGTNTQIVRPSDWNSAHNQWLTITGNTLGQSTASGTNIVLAGTNNISLSISQAAGQATVSISGPNVSQFLTTAMASNRGSDFVQATAAFAGTNASGTIASNGISVSVGNYITTQSGQAFSADASSTFQTLSFQNSNGVSFSNNAGALRVTHDLQYTSATSAITSNALNTSASRVINVVAATNNTGGGTASLSSNVSFSAANGVTFYTSAGGAIVASHNALTSQNNQAISAANGSYSFQTLSFSNANGVSFGTSAGSAITASHNGLTTARASNDGVGLNTAQSNVTWTVNSSGISLDGRGYAGTGTTFNGANISGSITQNSAGLNLSLSVAPGGGGADGYNMIAAGTQTAATTGTVKFENSNGISFGMSNSSVVTASYTVPSTAGLLSAVNVSAGTTSNNLSALTFANANGITFGLNASTVTASHNGLTTARASNDAVGLNTALTAGPLAWTVNSSGISLNASSAAGTTSGFGGNLISGSMTHNTAGLNLSLNHPAWLTTAAQSSASNVSAVYAATNNTGGGTATLSGGVSFSNANSATFYTSAGNAIVLSLPAYLTTARGSTDAIGLNTAQTNVTWTVNSSGLSLNAAGYAGTGTTFAGTNVSASATLNSNGLNLALSAGAGGGGVTPVASASNGSFSFTTVAFSNANNVTFGTSAGSIITASVAAPGAAAENNWVNLLGANTAGNTTASGSTIGYSGVNLTLSGTNGSQVVISAPPVSSLVADKGLTLSSAGSTISVRPVAASYFAYPQIMANSQTQTVGASTSVVWPFDVHDLEEVGFIRMPQTVSISSMASVATTANTTFSYNQQGTYNFVLYTRGIGASSLSLQSVQSTQYTSRNSINVQANANGSQWSVTHGYTFQASSTTSGVFSTTYATTLTNINISTTHLTRLTGMKFAGYQWAMTLNPSMYWMAHGFSTAQTTNGLASLSNMRVTVSSWGMSQPNNTWGEFGDANTASVQALYGLGSYTTNGVTTASIPLANVSSSASHIIPYLTMGRIT